MPALAAEIENQLGNERWTIELEPEDKDNQTILSNYPRAGSYAAVGYP